MAKPRVFISSTFYDLKQIRAELDKFIRILGYESVRSEHGDIPYGKDKKPADYCMKEIENVDILISIIGGRFGSTMQDDKEYSVTQKELKTAIDCDKQVYIFIEKNVYVEYETYKINKNNQDINYHYVDDVRIYKFLDQIYTLSRNNPIKDFEMVDDITNFLREQFAGHFKKMIDDEAIKKQMNILNEINSTAATLHKLVEYLKSDNENRGEEFMRLIKLDHPLIAKLKDVLDIHYNIYIDGMYDLQELLISNGLHYDNENDEWQGELEDSYLTLKISRELFDKNDKLVYMTHQNWRDEYFIETHIPIGKTYTSDNDFPF